VPPNLDDLANLDDNVIPRVRDGAGRKLIFVRPPKE
jgi:hypothetical protein